MEPKGPGPGHRRKNEPVWGAVFDLRNYFIDVTGRPHMGLLQRLFYPNQNEATFSSEWHERKGWFVAESGPQRLEQLRLFYTQNHRRVLETLRTGIPFYAKWESQRHNSTQSGRIDLDH